MNEKLEQAIENTLSMIRANCRADDALKFSQSALNLAHVRQLLGKATTKGAGS